MAIEERVRPPRGMGGPSLRLALGEQLPRRREPRRPRRLSQRGRTAGSLRGARLRKSRLTFIETPVALQTEKEMDEFEDEAVSEPATDINRREPHAACRTSSGSGESSSRSKLPSMRPRWTAKSSTTLLFVGPPGLGKTAIAKVVACEMASDFHEVLGQSIKAPADLNAVLLSAKEKSIVFIDECHEMKPEYQTALYLALDKRKVIVSGGRTPLSMKVADFTLLLATTDEHRLLQPLRDRMRLVLRFDFYNDGELETVVRQRSRGLGWTVDEAVFPLIAQRSRGTPRIALRLLQACRRVCRAEGETTITEDQLRRACELEGIDELGLGPTEQKYLGDRERRRFSVERHRLDTRPSRTNA